MTEDEEVLNGTELDNHHRNITIALNATEIAEDQAKLDEVITPPPSNHGTPTAKNNEKTTYRFSQLKVECKDSKSAPAPHKARILSLKKGGSAPPIIEIHQSSTDTDSAQATLKPLSLGVDFVDTKHVRDVRALCRYYSYFPYYSFEIYCISEMNLESVNYNQYIGRCTYFGRREKTY